MAEESNLQSAASAWSAPNNGLAGRLRVEFEDLQPGLRHAVYLELRSHSFTPIAVINQPTVHAELRDTEGKSVGDAGSARSGPVPSPQWGVIPPDAYIGFRIDMQSIGVPMRGQGAALLAVGGKVWLLKAGTYTLKVALVFERRDDGPPDQWVGELNPPSVEFVVAAELLGQRR